MNALGTGGFGPEQIVKMTKAVLDLARAGDADAGTAGTVLADALNAFQLPAEAAVAVADKFTVAANKSAVSLASLGETFQYVGPVAKAFGMSMEKALALSGALGSMGIRGSEAGTALRRMTVELGANEAAMNRLFGVTGRDANGGLRSVVDVLDDIQKSMSGLDAGKKIEKLNEFFGLLGITSAVALGNSTASVRELEDAINNAGGTAERTAKQMDAGLGGVWRKIKGNVEGAAIALGDVLSPALTAASVGIGKIIDRVTTWVSENRQLATRIGAVVVGLIALAAAGLGILTIAKGIALAVVAVKALVAVVGLLFNPFVWLGVLVGVLLLKWLKFSEDLDI